MVTADQNLTYQQNLKGRKIALVVLGSNDWSIVRQQMDTITATVEAAQVNSYTFVEMPLPPKRPYIRRTSEGREPPRQGRETRRQFCSKLLQNWANWKVGPLAKMSALRGVGAGPD